MCYAVIQVPGCCRPKPMASSSCLIFNFLIFFFNFVVLCRHSGSRLLSADADGLVKCWAMQEHLVNRWHSELSSSVDGDPVVALSWLHNGVKLALHVEMSGSTNFGEKFSRVKFSPSLTLFGGKPMEGWLAVTASGLVAVALLKPGGGAAGGPAPLLTASESLCRLRGRVALADIAFTGGGNIVVAATDGSASSPVQFYKVVVSVVSEKCRIDTELLPSLFLRCTSDPLRRDKYPAVTHLKFLTRENSEQVLLCASNQSGSIVECWSLRKEGLPVNNIFQHRSPVVGEKQPTILKWRILTTTGDLERVSAVALPKLPISISNTDLKVATDTKFCPGLGLALSFQDGSIQILHRLSLHTMGVYYGPPSEEPPLLKRPRPGPGPGPGPGPHFKALQFSWTSLALAGVDNQGKLHMLRVSPSMGQVLDPSTALRHLLLLLEYCMVTGYDWWDVLLHVQPAAAAPLAERLHEEYTRQNQALQQVLAARVVAAKASLCRLSAAAAPRASDLHAKLLLMAVGATLKSLLRPHAPAAPDKSPGERLSEICAKNTDTDIDKVMLNLKTEEFVLDGPPLQSLQQLIQWLGDFVLHLLASLPQQHQQGATATTARPGSGFLRDGASLGLLREMLVMIRIWGLLKPGCLPVFTATSDTQDSLLLLFRLLTKLWLCARDDAPPQEPDDSLLDECCLLPSQLLVPQLDWLPAGRGVTVRLQAARLPLRLAFGRCPAPCAGGSSPPPDAQKVDHLRCVHMGVLPTEESKACTRCGCVTMLRSPNKTSAMKQWEQRWIKNFCICLNLSRIKPEICLNLA
uniref:Mediator of RNA polymerase II transcription subunit 16 n=1 Tax=Salarias fasciatus TaxID=181472 RepID=A0A672FU89_SALFA